MGCPVQLGIYLPIMPINYTHLDIAQALNACCYLNFGVQ